MDVTPWPYRAIGFCLVALTLISCGNRFDLSTSRGRQSRIDDANLYLSEGNCAEALAAIEPLYSSPYVDDETRIVKASALACQGTFNFLSLAGNLAQGGNAFASIARSMSNTPNDGARSSMYAATDVLTRNNTVPNAVNRSMQVNTYMFFLQVGVIGAIMRNYGSPASDGTQGADLVYDVASNPAGEMTNLDACALSAALTIMVDSFRYSSVTSSSAAAVTNTINGICTAAGHANCSNLVASRTSCDGTNTDSQASMAVVAGLNAAW